VFLRALERTNPETTTYKRRDTHKARVLVGEGYFQSVAETPDASDILDVVQ